MLTRCLALLALLALAACGDDTPERPVYTTENPAAAGLSVTLIPVLMGAWIRGRIPDGRLPR